MAESGQGRTLIQLLGSLASRVTQHRMPFLFLPNPAIRELLRTARTDTQRARSTEILKTSKPGIKTVVEGSNIGANSHASLSRCISFND